MSGLSDRSVSERKYGNAGKGRDERERYTTETGSEFFHVLFRLFHGTKAEFSPD